MSKYVPIGEICYVYDGPHATPIKTKSGPIYLGIDAVTDGGRLNSAEFSYLSESDYKIWTKRVTPQCDDIVFSYEATLGRYAMIPEGFYGCLGRRLAIVRAKDSRVNPRWLYYYFLSPEWSAFIANHTVKGSTVNRISVEDYPNYPIPLPERKTQDAVVEVLSTIDQKIDNNTNLCVKLESMAKTLYDYWFTQFDFPDENGKPYCSSGGEMVWNDQLKREIPKGWDVRPLSHVISSINTGLNPRDNFILGNGDIQYLTVKNLTTSGTIDFSGCDTVDEQAREIIHKRSDVSVGDILFASIAPLGRCYLIQNPPEKWDINESVFSIRRNASRVTSEFLYMYFISDTFIKAATSSSTGSIFKGIRINTLLDIAAVIPPKDIVTAFTTQVKTLLALKEQKGTENRELTKLRDWLLPMLMNGQATVE
jgi:type I restriction enzyme S subunit